MKRNAREKSSRVDGNYWPAGHTTISVRSDSVTRSQSARLCTSRTQISTANSNTARPCSASPHQSSAWTNEAQGRDWPGQYAGLHDMVQSQWLCPNFRIFHSILQSTEYAGSESGDDDTDGVMQRCACYFILTPAITV